MKGIWTYHQLLPAVSAAHRITLGEGDTPLVPSRRIGPSLGLRRLYFKLEILNPTGSYKDRFAAAAVSQLIEKGAPASFATSSGNTGAALAAYCAAAGIPAFTVTVDGAPAGKIQQMQAYGAHVLSVRDFGKDAAVSREVMDKLAAMARTYNAPVQISAYAYHPDGMAGVQTIAYEIAAAQDKKQWHVFSPAGGGGLTLAVANGFIAWENAHRGYRMPRVHCVQPAGNNTIAGPLRDGAEHAVEIPAVTTAISGLQVPNILDGDTAIQRCRQTGGTGFLVPDTLVYNCQQRLAMEEGIFCEPAGAVSLAGLMEALQDKAVDRDTPIVCLVTGHGFKDPAGMARIADHSPAHRLENAQALEDFVHSILIKNKNYKSSAK
ncbi:threonine synthase [Chitinophaga lutea]